MNSRFCSLLVNLAVAVVALPAAHAGVFYSTPHATFTQPRVADDGSAALFNGFGDYYWTPSGSTALTGGVALSGDGGVVLGIDAGQVSLWKPATGWTSLSLSGGTSYTPLSLNGDGTAAYGVLQNGGTTSVWQWTSGGGQVSLGTVPFTPTFAAVDGSAFVGFDGVNVLRYVPGSGTTILAPPSGDTAYGIQSMSDDGSHVLGGSAGTGGMLVWDASGAVTLVTTVPGGWLDVSNNGTVVGVAPEPFTWDPVNGSRSLREVFEADGLNLGGETIGNGWTISGNGRVVAGGLSPISLTSFVASLSVPIEQIGAVPEPATAAWGLVAAAGLAIRRARQRQ